MPNVEKSHRQTIGAKIDELFIEELDLSFRASYAPDSLKSTLLKQAVGKNDLLKFFITITWECRIIDDKKYIKLSEMLIEVGKMLFGWNSYMEKKTPPHH